jgi:hypothetical protein
MRTDRYGVWCIPTSLNPHGTPGWLPHNHSPGRDGGWTLKTARAKAQSHNDNPDMARFWSYEVRRLTRESRRLAQAVPTKVHTKHCVECGGIGHNMQTCTQDPRLPLPFKNGLRRGASAR